MSLCGFEPQLTNLEFIVYPPKLKKCMINKAKISPKEALKQVTKGWLTHEKVP